MGRRGASRLAGRRAWLPRDVSSCVLHASPQNQAAGTPASIVDFSRRGNTLTPTAVTLTTSGSPNGNPIAACGGGYATTASLPLLGAKNWSFHAVVSGSVTGMQFILCAGTGATGFGIGLKDTTNTRMVRDNSTGTVWSMGAGTGGLWEVWTVTCDNSGNITGRVNGVQKLAPTATSFVAPSGTSRLWAYSNGTLYWKGTSADVVLCSTMPSTADIARIEHWLAARNGIDGPQIVCDGNSLTLGTGSTGGQTYPAQLAALLGAKYNIVTHGVSGVTTPTMTTNAPTAVDPYLSVLRRAPIVLFWECTNDSYFGASAATVISDMLAYCAARRAAGWKVIVGTYLSRSNGGTPGAFNTDRATVNAYIRANWASFADGIADFAADARIGVDGAESNGTYFSGDLVHLSNAGYAIVAGIAQTAIQSALAAPAP